MQANHFSLQSQGNSCQSFDLHRGSVVCSLYCGEILGRMGQAIAMDVATTTDMSRGGNSCFDFQVGLCSGYFSLHFPEQS